MTEKDKKRFWAKVDKCGPDECLELQSAFDSGGYGLFLMGKNKRAHRITYEIANGPIDLGLYICHHCDNPSCVNPAHLFAGTQYDNMQDSIAKGRFTGFIIPAGDASKVAELLKAHTQEDVAKMYDVSRTTVRNFLKRHGLYCKR
jgi:hypothetical protein